MVAGCRQAVAMLAVSDMAAAQSFFQVGDAKIRFDCEKWGPIFTAAGIKGG